MAETFRGAVLAVPVGLLEAGYAYGMSKHQVFFRILVPQMMRHALPGLGNNWLVLMKVTALVSVIGLHDLVFRAGQAGGTTREPFLFRSEERRVGKEWVGTCRSRWAAYH